MINNNAYGGFLVSNNVLSGIPIRYSFREKSRISQLNGWTLLSENDDDSYVNNPKNFTIINAESMTKIAPQLLEIFDASYGTDLFWIYKEGVHIGFYDLISDKEMTIEQILNSELKQ